MMTRLFATAIALAALTGGAAFAQTGTGSSGTSSGTSTTTPGSGSMGSGSTGSTTGTGGNTMGGGSGMGNRSNQQAQQPMNSGSFDASSYTSKTDCMNAAAMAKASPTACNNLK